MKTKPAWRQLASKEYLKAYEAHNETIRIFIECQKQYRLGNLTDNEYLEIRGIKNRADQAFDEAFKIESKRQ